MIVVVTPNPALDITYHVDSLDVGQVNRVGSVIERAGGKGLNVARLLHAHDIEVCAVAPIGGATGAQVRALLDRAGVPHDLTGVSGDTRRTVVIVDNHAGHEVTGLWEPGPLLTDREWITFRESVARRLGRADVVVLSGSLPPGWPVDTYSQLIALANDAGAPAILDTSGAALRHGIAARPRFVKPNAAELEDLVGEPVVDPATAVAAARSARRLGARDLVISLGDAGLVAVAGDDVWRSVPPSRFAGNATGAGDALVAALAVGVLRADPWPDRLVRMTAWSAAAAAHSVAGEVDASLVERLTAGLRVEAARLS